MPTPAVRSVSLTAVVLLAACGGEGADTSADAPPSDTAVPSEAAGTPITVAGVGFSTPESVLHDPSSDTYLVSNIAGAPLDRDGNGFISRLSPSGEVLELKWIDGEAEGVTLDAPKGMAISGGRLWVADIDCVRIFDLPSGEPSGEVCIEGATFLNDVAPHPGGDAVLVTDSGLDAEFGATGSDALYHVTDATYAPVLMDPGLGAPNGVAADAQGRVLVVTFMSGRALNVTGPNEYTEMLSVDGAQLDGVQMLDDGRILVSNWSTSCVHVIDTEGVVTCAMPDLEAPADIGFDAERERVLVPLFNADEVRILPLG